MEQLLGKAEARSSELRKQKGRARELLTKITKIADYDNFQTNYFKDLHQPNMILVFNSPRRVL